MRITGGQFKGRNLQAPSTIDVRPTTDFAKIGLFNILSNKIDFEEIKVLDLYCGIGGISFEFLSRRCKQLTSVDQNKKACDFVIKCSKDLDLKNHLVINRDALKFIKENDNRYDLIFADPPYNSQNYQELVKLITEKYVGKEVLFILEHSSEYSFENFKGFEMKRNYGKVNFSFFQF